MTAEPADADERLLSLAAGAFGTVPPDAVGVAVSGGSDSMALLHLTVRALAERGGIVRAVTVDHRLRPEAAAEARFVRRFCAKLGAGHDTLVWDHGDLVGNVSDQARRARYSLIADWARRNEIGHVVVGHTADDRAETFLMELAREAGVDGLAAMRRHWRSADIQWARPLLSVGRDTLRAYLRRQQVDWIDDPTNEDGRYQRVKARRALAALAPLGIRAEGLARVAGHLAVARAELMALAARAAEDIATERAGEVLMDRARWLDLGPDTRRRLVSAALRWVSSASYAPRAAELARLEAAIMRGRDATLSGCHVRVSGSMVRYTREPKAVAGLECPSDTLWDGRWRLSGPHHPALRIRALGAAGLRQCDNWRATGQVRAALIVSPAVWRGETLVAAPVAGMAKGWTAEIATDFASCLLAH